MNRQQGFTLSRRSKPHRSGLAAAAVVGLIAAGALTAPTAQATPTSVHVTLGAAGGDKGNPAVKQTPRTDGYTVASVVRGNVEVRASAPNGSTFDLTTTSADDGKSGSIASSVTTPDDKGNGVNPMQVIAENKRLGRSVITEVMTLGSSYEDAVRDFGSMMAPGEVPTKAAAERTVALALGKTTTTAAAEPTATQLAAAPGNADLTADTDTGTYYDTACKTTYIDGDVHMKGCDARWLDYKGSNGQWYLHHKLKVPVQYDSFWSALDNFYMYSNYASGGTGDGNEFVDWDPYQHQPVGSCYTETFSVSYKGFGGSTTATICPAAIDPRFYTHGYGVEWTGLSSYWRVVAGMGSVSSPPGAPVSRTVGSYMHWRIK